MTQLLSEYENNGINARVFKLHDDTVQVLVFNINTGNETSKMFKNYSEASRYAENATIQQLNG